MQRQVVLLASNSESNISAWDLHTGTHLTSYKSNASPRNGLCCLGHDYIVSAQTTKDALHFWTWHKDQVLQRSFTSERIFAVAASSNGTLIAAGAVSGNIYIWEAASGRLLKSWPAHYKAVTSLVFVESGVLLLSAGEDTLVNVWLLSELLDVSQDPSSAQYLRPAPLHSWSEHTLPVTSICCGQGDTNAVVVTASLDRSVKIHGLADGRLLRTFTFPASIHSVVLDSGEHCLYAGAGNGTIFEVSLVGDASSSSGSSGGGDATVGSSSGGGRGLAAYPWLAGHNKTVNSLAVSFDGENLVSGSDDGTAIVWDLRSRQPIQTLQSHGKQPVTCVMVMPTPRFLAPGSGGSVGSGRPGPKRVQPLAPLVKFAGMPGSLKPWEGAPVVLDGSNPFQGIARACGLWGEPSAIDFNQTASSAMADHEGPFGSNGPAIVAAANGDYGKGPSASSVASAAALQEEVERLKAELARAQSTAQQWKELHSELHSFALEKVLRAGP